MPKKLLDQNFDLGPRFRAMGAQKWPKFQNFVFGRRGFKFSDGILICYMKSFMQ